MTETRTRRVASFANACRWVATRTDVEGLTMDNSNEYPFVVFVSEVFMRDIPETVSTINGDKPTARAARNTAVEAPEDTADAVSDGATVEAAA